MDDDIDIRTERLLLRRWRESDRDPWAAICADPEVMRYFPAPLTREQSDASFDQIAEHFTEHGFGSWAVERRDCGEFIGFVGIHHIPYDAHFTPAVEIGWRLAREAWNVGYATEAARAVLDVAFDSLGMDEVVSVTVPGNAASRRVMEKLGLTQDLDGDFDHPNLPEEQPLRRHVLYRIVRG